MRLLRWCLLPVSGLLFLGALVAGYLASELLAGWWKGWRS